MAGFRTYNGVLLGIVGAVALTIAVVSLHLEPLWGDLTRIGGYRENDFGWREPMAYFPEKLFAYGASLEDYDQDYDVIVIGDSFSERSRRPAWQNYWVAQTGLSLLSFTRDDVSLSELRASGAYRAHPPRILIYEFVERSLGFDHRGTMVAVPFTDAARSWVPVETSPRSVSLVKRSRERRRAIDLNEASNYLYKVILRRLGGINPTKAVALDLSRRGLFSSRVSDRLLIYDDDLLKIDVLPGDVDEIRANLEGLQYRVEAEGRTVFVCMIAPDKPSAYAAYLEPPYSEMGILPRLADGADLRLPRLDLALQEAIGRGVVDIYLPNDTHWGSEGCRIAAATVSGYLEKIGVIQPPTSGSR